ncbi:MAG: M36 family metallopeptidase, partial [Bacteroidota bacterium]
LAGELVLATDAVGTTTDGCDPLTNAADLVGKIALVDRGNCQFGTKVLAMEEAGAIAVIVCNNTDDNEEAGLIFAMNPGVDGDQVTIPAVMISLNNCNTIKMDLPGVTVSFENGIPNPGPTGRDSDFDNGVIVHEYTHGISTRLTGGRLQSGCLSSQDQDEQAGEGWSDWFALVMTTTSENFADEPRGIGTYANGQSPAGGGIREYPYTRDMTINEHTYADVTSVSVPHGVGSIFCATLWDMYWNLVDEYGFDDDIFAGTGGNNIAMQLVIDGMKLQPCLPNFIEARDAIIEADEANNNGANYCLIWETFARRGIGASAQDGGVEAFDLPFDCPPAYRVVKTGPEAVTAGENITYNLSIVNGRSETIADAVVTDRIPAGTIYVEGSATCDVSVDGQELTFNLGQATPGAEFDCSYELATDPGLGSRINFEDRVPNGGMWDFANDGSNENNFTLRVNDAYTGILSFIARNYEERSDMFLVLEEPVTLEGTSPGMTFWHQYFTETDVDGGVVEISADGGTTWEDVGADNIPVNGYTTTLASTDNPLAGRPAFSGSSEWIRSMLDLSAYAGQTVLVRFRFGSNSGGARLGWIIDDITVFDDLNYLENTACTDNDGEELCSTVITVVNTDLNSNTLEINQTRSLELYPNPVQETLTVSLAETITETVEVALLGTDGKVLQSQQFSQFQQTELDLSNLPAGIYLLRFQTETDVTTRRVVKQ